MDALVRILSPGGELPGHPGLPRLSVAWPAKPATPSNRGFSSRSSISRAGSLTGALLLDRFGPKALRTPPAPPSGQPRSRLSDDSGGPFRYNGIVSTQNALKLLYELRAVLDRLGENDSTLREALAQDIDRAVRLTNSCITQLAQYSPDPVDIEEEEEDD